MRTEKPIARAGLAEHTEAIKRRIEESVAYHSRHPDKIGDRLKELEEEWDVERVLEANLSGAAVAGMTFGMFRRAWLVLPILSAAFFMQRAFSGWCAPLGLLQKLGFRTLEEIDRERYALKLLRGDFKQVERPVAEEHGVRDLIDAIYH